MGRIGGGCLAVLGFVLTVSGCTANKFPSVERPKGQLEMRRPKADHQKRTLHLQPATAVQSQAGLEITIRHASPEDLDAFFDKKEIFGDLAGVNPYPDDTVVFYVKINNGSSRKISVDPNQFVLMDDINIQYSELSPDNLSAIYDSKASVWSFAKTTGDLAPGPYGTPLKVAGALGGSGGRKLHYLMKQVRLAPGMVHAGIAYDGYVAFPRPHPDAKKIRLLIANVKTDFNPADEPAVSMDFEFPFDLEAPSGS
ncbi:MAG: hypothetical protein COV76_05845 [Candidatus Omnitrophica bacterium CG11_big_fil_rev_8_21_14_0_20_64_10]|nr:MAG: hypothetical protein COV76_05845 [Candidatus Omnitrophica bacterium CG11_big_fil_rev_8_21_14_0_20_64_10]